MIFTSDEITSRVTKKIIIHYSLFVAWPGISVLKYPSEQIYETQCHGLSTDYTLSYVLWSYLWNMSA